jgi:HEAT repeat protein
MNLFKPNIEKLKAKKNVEKLIKAGKHPDPAVRRESIGALGELGDKRAVEPLIQALLDKDFDVEIRAAQALGKIGDERAVEPLINILKYKSPYYSKEQEAKRANAALALSNFCKSGDERAVKFFIQALKDATHYDIQKTTIEALGRIEDKRAVKLLIQALKDEKLSVRQDVVRILDRLAWTPEDVLERAYYILAKQGWLISKEMHESALPGLLQIFSSDCPLSIRILAAINLGAIGDKRAVEPLIQALKDKDIGIRGYAAAALGKIGDKRAVEPLIQALQDEKIDFRKTAAEALGKIGDVRAVEPLIQALKDKDINIRGYAAAALGEIEDERATEPLMQALQDKTVGTGRAAEAAEALGKIGDRKYAGTLIDYLFSNPNEIVSEMSDYFQKKAAPYKNMFRDYAELIIRITSYESSSYRSPGSPTTWYRHGIREALSAAAELGNIDSPISSNILHKISGMHDIKVVEENYDNDETYISEKHYGSLSFEALREKAKEELRKRGNTPYDPSAYLIEDGWKI